MENNDGTSAGVGSDSTALPSERFSRSNKTAPYPFAAEKPVPELGSSGRAPLNPEKQDCGILSGIQGQRANSGKCRMPANNSAAEIGPPRHACPLTVAGDETGGGGTAGAVPSVFLAAKGAMQQRVGSRSSPSLLWSLASPPSSTCADVAVELEAAAYDTKRNPVPTVSAPPLDRSGVGEDCYFSGAVNHASRPCGDFSSKGIALASGSAAFRESCLVGVALHSPSGRPPAPPPPSQSAGPVRIAILPPKTEQEERVSSSPLLSPGEVHSPLCPSPAGAARSPTARSPVAAPQSPVAAALPSPDDSASIPALKIPNRCYSLFPPPNTAGASAQLSPTQTTTSRSPISTRSPGILTPQQQKEQKISESRQQPEEVWHVQQKQHHAGPPLVAEQVFQQQQSPVALQHRNAGPPSGAAATCTEEADAESLKEEQRLQHRLQQLHHSLLAQLSACSTAAVAKEEATPMTAEATPDAAGDAGNLAVADDVGCPKAADPAATTTTAAIAAAARGISGAAVSVNGEHLENKKAELEEAQQQQQQQTTTNSKGGNAAGSSVTADLPVDAVAASPIGAGGLSTVTADDLFSEKNPTPQQLPQNEQPKYCVKQQEGEIKDKQEEHFPALFRSLSLATLPGEEPLYIGEVAEGTSSSDNTGSGASATDNRGNCRESSMNAMGTSKCCAVASPVVVSGRETTAGAGAAGAAAGVTRFIRYPPPPDHRLQQEGRNLNRFSGQRSEKKRHSVAGNLCGRGGGHTAVFAAAAAAAEWKEWRTDTGLETGTSSCCSSSYSSSSSKSGGDSAPSSDSSSSSCAGRTTLGDSGQTAITHSCAGLDRFRNSRSEADLATVGSCSSGLSELIGYSDSSSSGSGIKREEGPDLEGHCSAGGWTGALLPDDGNRRTRENSAVPLNEKDRAALRAALLARQDYLQRFLQATRQALSALEDDTEGAADKGNPLSTAGSPGSLQSSNTGGSCRLSGAAAACCTPLSPDAAVSPSQRFPGMFVPSIREQLCEQKQQLKLLSQQSQHLQGQSRRPLSRPSHFRAATMPPVTNPLLLSPPCFTSASPCLVAAGAAAHALAETAAAPAARGGGPGGTSTTSAGRGFLESDGGCRSRALAHRSLTEISNSGGTAEIAASASVDLQPKDEKEAAAAAAAAAAAEAVVAAAASLLERRRQQAERQQQAPHQPEQRQRSQLRQQPVRQDRQRPCQSTLGPAMASEEETAAGELELLSGVSQAGGGVAVSSRTPDSTLCSDSAAAATTYAAATSPTAFGSRGAIRSKTAPASSVDEKAMRGFLSFLRDEEEGDFSVAEMEAASLLHQYGQTGIRAANTPYTADPAVTIATAAAAGDALAALLRAGHSSSAISGLVERRERPRVRFEDYRVQELQGDGAKNTQSLGGSPDRLQSGAQKQHLLQQQHQHDVCPVPPNQSKTELRRPPHSQQQCSESDATSGVPAPLASSASSLTLQNVFLNAVAAAAAAAAAAEKRGRSTAATAAGNYYTDVGPAPASRHEQDPKTDPALQTKSTPSPMFGGETHLLAAGVPTWTEASASRHAEMVASSVATPWATVPVVPQGQRGPEEQQGQQQQQRQQGALAGLTASAASMKPSLHSSRADGIAAILQQERQQQQQLRNASALLSRPQRRTTVLPCSTANVLFQSMDVQALLHLQCRCKPCAFYYNRKGCRNGMNCEFCHHEDHSKLTVKQWKKQQHKLSRHARCLALEEERAVTVVAGVSIGARCPGVGGSLLSAAGRQNVGTSPTPSKMREAAVSASIPIMPVLGDDSESAKSTCGPALLLRSDGGSSRSDCGSFLYGTPPGIISADRCGDPAGALATSRPALSGHGFEQSSMQLESAYQAGDA